jgi:HindIII restriction endonuclease
MIINDTAKQRRTQWIQTIASIDSDFTQASHQIQETLRQEINQHGTAVLLEHLRRCGSIPECYAHDSSQEKLYSKYTDCVLAEAFNAIGLKSLVLQERADSTDVEVFADTFDFVADAKAFRLSRTAKNQKDFKVQAMDGWRGKKHYAMVVCPVYQLPVKTSQIYQQASVRNVCIFTYSHLAMLVAFAEKEDGKASQDLLYQVFTKGVNALNPSKDAGSYWLAINQAMLTFSKDLADLWATEKRASLESISIAKKEALDFLAEERAKIMRMNHAEALTELVRVYKLDSRIKAIESVTENQLLNIR